MKPRFRSALPPLDRSARLPLALAAVLVAAFAFQLLAVDDVTLPPVGPVGRGARTDGAATSPAPAGPGTIARTIFAPAAAPAGAPGAAPSDPLGGFSVAGSVRVGRRVAVVVQRPDGRAMSVAIGGRIGGWRLLAVRADAALLGRGDERRTVPFGAGAPPPPAATEGNPQ